MSSEVDVPVLEDVSGPTGDLAVLGVQLRVLGSSFAEADEW